MDEILDVTLLVTGLLERLGVPYVVGGSLASSLHGVPRATQDADVVAALRPEHVPELLDGLEEGFYVDAEAIREALRRRSSFNVIHLRTMFKVDVFVATDDRVTQLELRRGQPFAVTEEPRRELVIASPEDTILQKLHWYRLGGEASERQWSDVLGMLKVGRDRLDLKYLWQTAAALEVEGLFRRACEEAGWQDGAKESESQ